MPISRRTFLVTGTAGAAALAVAVWLRGPHAPPSGRARQALDADAESILTVLLPSLLEGALPGEPDRRAPALDETLVRIDKAIAGMPPAVQREVAQLFALFALPPVRLGLARVAGSWQAATPADARAFLDRLRNSPVQLLRAAYAALHLLAFAGWYSNLRSWQAIGYAGPPDLFQ